MIVKLTPGMLEYAQWAEKEVIRATPRPTYTKLQAPNANYVGVLGELGAAFMFYRLSKKGYFRPRYDGHSDHGDMFVYVKGEAYPLDVKTASSSKAKYLMVPKAQYDVPGRDYTYIGCRLDGDRLEVLGYAKHDDLIEANAELRHRLDLKIPTMLIELDKLHPLQAMLDMVQAGSFVIELPKQERLSFV